MGNSSTREEFADALEKITQEDIPPDDTEFWDSLWRIPSTAFEVFELVSPDDVRNWLKERPGNLATLFTQGVAQLCQLVETPNPAFFNQALTCIRMLTRLIPFLLEKQQDRFLDQLFWGTTMSVIESSDEEGEPTHEPLAKLLMQSIYKLLFLPKFTSKDDEEDEVAAAMTTENTEVDTTLSCGNPTLIWAKGVGKTGVSFSTNAVDSNRREVLRLLIACLSDPLFQRPESYDPFQSHWHQMATSDEEPLVSTLFASLLNTVTSFDPYGWCIPYGTQMVDDAPQKLMESSLQTLLILLDYGVQSSQMASQQSDSSEQQPSDRPVVNSNAYRRLLSQIKDPKDIENIFEGLTRLLNNVHIAENTYLPGSYYKVECHQEILVLFWKLLEENSAFTSHILKFCDITKLLVPVCFLMFEARNLPSKVGLVHICTFLLLKLSGERSFGVLLNREFDVRLPMDLPIFAGTHTDFLIITLQKIIVTGSSKLSPLYHCFLTIICNISPYAKTLSLVASVKLVNLLETFISPKFFFSSDSNHMFVALILETFNNLIQYQYSGNAHLVYAIVRREEIFQKIANLSLPAAIVPPGVTGTGGVEEGFESPSLEENPEEPSVPGEQTNIVATKSGPEDVAEPPDNDGSSDSKTAEENPVKSSESEALESTATVKHFTESADNEQSKDEEKNEQSKDEETTEDSETKDEAKGNEESSQVSEEQPPQPPQQTLTGKDTESEDLIDEGGLPPTPPKKWVPTQEWLEQVKTELPTNTISRLLSYLVPQIDEMCQNASSGMDDVALMEFLKSTTMVGLLPVPHPIVIRKYQPNQFTGLWFTAYMWGVIFLRNHGLPIFDGEAIKLFVVTVT